MGGSILYSEIKECIDKYPVYKSIETFVETGTYKGETVHEMSKYFKDCITFELNEIMFNTAIENGKQLQVNNVIYILGDSVKNLPTTIDNYQLDTKPCLYFLDSHISGIDSSCIDSYPVPLMEELEIISKKCKSANVICIDDVRFFTQAYKFNPYPHDWAHISIEKINALFKGRIHHSFMYNDRYWLILDSTE